MPEPHAFAVRFSAVRLRAVDRSRETRPAPTIERRRCRVHRISARVRDDHDTPLLPGETGRVTPLICPTAPAKFCPTGYFAAAGALSVAIGEASVVSGSGQMPF